MLVCSTVVGSTVGGDFAVVSQSYEEGPTVGSFTNVGSTVGGKCVVESWRDDYSTIVLGTHC